MHKIYGVDDEAMRKTVTDYLKNTVEVVGNKAAVIDGGRSVTFRQLEARARCLAGCISDALGMSRAPVAILLPKSIESIVSFTAVLYSGNYYVPLDIKLPDARLELILDNLTPALVITLKEQKARLEGAGIDTGKFICIDEVDFTEPKSDTSCGNSTADSLIDTDPAYIIYTSGSTGVPKGVVISHRGIIDYIDWAVSCFKIDKTAIIGNQSPFYFDNSVLDIYLCLAAGATLVIIPEHLFAFPVRLMEYVNEQNINFIFWVPSVLINVANTNSLGLRSGCTLKKILFAGEVMPNKHLNYWRRMLPDAMFANLYGPTEITVDCTYYVVDREFSDHEPLPIGKARSNMDILVLSNENLPVSENEIGELCVRGSAVGLGYWRDVDKTGSVFVQNPLNPYYPETIYRTGDLVYFNERKELIFVGRKDSQIKHMGYRIELGDIENAFNCVQGIHSACVIYDSGRRELVAFYTSDEQCEEAAVRKALLADIPRYMIPARYIRLKMFPLNANGKIDRKTISDNYFKSCAYEAQGGIA